MGQKKIKRSKTGAPTVDPNLEEVDQDRAFEMELDEEDKEIVLVHHYRYKWGDDMDADVEHCLTIEEAGELIGALLSGIEALNKLKVIEKDKILLSIEKRTPEPIEGNPLQGPNNREGA